MTDETERPEDTVRRFAGQMELYEKTVQELQAWRSKYREAAEMWDALELEENQQVTQVVMIAKIADFDSGYVNVGMSASDGVDWIDQVGLIETARIMSYQKSIVRADGDDDD